MGRESGNLESYHVESTYPKQSAALKTKSNRVRNLLIAGAIGVGILYLFTRLVQLSNSPQAPLRAEFDIPSLLGKNVYEIKAILGTPSSDNEDPSSAENFVEFSRTLSSVFLPYDRRTGTIINDGPHGGLFLSEPGGTYGKDRLLELGNLDENDARYSLKFVNVMRSGAPEAGHYTGVVIQPK